MSVGGLSEVVMVDIGKVPSKKWKVKSGDQRRFAPWDIERGLETRFPESG